MAAISSAATSVDQPTPSPMRMPVRISGSALGSTTKRSTCQRVAPSARAARTLTCATLRTPATADSVTGAKIAR